MSDKASPARKPIHKIRNGAIEVAVWQHDGEKLPWFSVTHRRSYKQGEEWKDADSYGQDDILLLCKLLDMAHTWILTRQQQSKQQAA